MPLARPSAAGHEAVCRFYSAFFTWSRMSSSPRHHVTSSSNRHSRVKLARPSSSRSYWTNGAPTPTLPIRKVKSGSKSEAGRIILLRPSDASLVLGDDEDLLKKIVKGTGARYAIDERSAKGIYQGIRLAGHRTAVEEASKKIMDSCNKPDNDDVDEKLKIYSFAGSIESIPSVVSDPKADFVDNSKSQFATSELYTLSALDRHHVHKLSQDILDDVKTTTQVETLAFETLQGENTNHLNIRLTGPPFRINQAKQLLFHFFQSQHSHNLGLALKTAMRAVPHPMAVITTHLVPHSPPDQDSKLSNFRGMALSSFTTVTLSPNPIISFNIRTPSRTYDALVQNKSFNLHIPAANPTGRLITHAFTKPHSDPAHAFRVLMDQGIRIRGRGAEARGEGEAASSTAAATLAPKKHDGFLTTLKCNVLKEKTVEIGDHKVLFAVVRGVIDSTPPPSSSSVRDDADHADADASGSGEIEAAVEEKKDEQKKKKRQKEEEEDEEEEVNGLAYVRGRYGKVVNL